ncbi:dTDP-4-dehydrorhamnose 3,5-epimerase [Limnobacter humi]|uniref:dTDP-4-dehydrorhamnose 3,5-epimerase n=1 Tax=Limnobacter humi TaxID=1778671 RepID=A0ABT1WJN9_9BURK|nr:dTDP-4-dehydrorhamnose 3,5-epimerase [Limnobacter humi]MCQ8897737.1 dTDP-4-dehydrorhamnose 3,5-epimerase [Limnobacter humi]
MNIVRRELGGALLLKPTVHADNRGFFCELFNEQAFKALTGLDVHFVQDNQSVSHKGVLRGLHCQTEPHAQGKLIQVVSGATRTVAVDLRRDSPSFGQWAAFELSGARQELLWLPPGFAHGFYVLEDNTLVQYKVTDYWSAEHEVVLKWDDPALGIDWQFDGVPVVSEKDSEGMSWKSFDC